MSERSIALRVEHLSYTYDGTDEPALEDVTFRVEAGRLVGIVGPNGAGKSTLVKSIVGSLTPDRGTVEVLGESGRAAVEKMTYVPQRGSVDWDFPVTVRDVVTQGRYGSVGLLGRISREDRRCVDEALAQVGITELGDRQIGELSGGQRQRAFLARALAHDGQVFLMDEPFVGVDARTERAIVDVLQRLRDDGRTVLVVHHDLSTVRDYFDHLLLLDRRVLACGPTEEVFTPELLRETYGGQLAIFDARDESPAPAGG